MPELTRTAMWTTALVIVVVALWWPATAGLTGADLVKARLDTLKVGVEHRVSAAGGVVALYLVWRRQHSTEAALSPQERTVDDARADAIERRITELCLNAGTGSPSCTPRRTPVTRTVPTSLSKRPSHCGARSSPRTPRSGVRTRAGVTSPAPRGSSALRLDDRSGQRDRGPVHVRDPGEDLRFVPAAAFVECEIPTAAASTSATGLISTARGGTPSTAACSSK
ncbi:hypothetical protein ACFWIW_28200 [Amycolatopsis sp. NPDC058340]|uniref:hypothetical protein n=1 Tax=Amycolatopsis sp. NPDC058340 TaxID=3346453 RepID=UPI00366128FF